jgi:NADH-quinone oxidoreductase subunit M
MCIFYFKETYNYALYALMFLHSSKFLCFIISLPLFCVLSLLFFFKRKKNLMVIREFSLFVTILIFFCCQVLWFFFDYGYSGYQFMSAIPLGISRLNTYYWFGLDGISFFFFYLTALIFPFCLLSGYKKVHSLKLFISFLLVLEFFLLVSFSTMDILVFYIAFEAVLIPMFFIIGIWGSGFARIRAAYFFFFFTFVGSLFFILAIFILFLNTGTTNFLVILNITNMP